MIKLLLILFFYLDFVFCSLIINPQIGSNKTFNIPFEVNYNFNDNFSIKHINRLFHINHPQNNYFHYIHQRKNVTAITEVSYIKYNKNNFEVLFGRNFLNAKNELLFSNQAPPLDYFKIQFKKNKIDFNFYIIKLNNNKINCTGNDECFSHWNDNINHYYNRWLYFRDISISINPKIKIKLSEALLSTGENRGIEWYYLLPFGLSTAEKKHNSRGIDTPYNFDNDNSFFNIGLNYLLNKNYSIDINFLIDDFQVDSEDRGVYEDVFGYLFGISYQKKNLELSINYKYASPWLYINNGIFTNYTHYDFPLGIRYPHSHFIDLNFKYILKQSKLFLKMSYGEKGQQTITYKWDSENNNIDNYNFDNSIPLELYIKYDLNNKLYPNIIIFHNWMESEKTNFILEWEIILNE